MKFSSFNCEESVLAYWDSHKVLEQLRSREGPRFYWCQGPPYTSGKLHIGHAWNMAIKDAVLRYKRLNGFKVWDRNGYDMHGLPTEQKTMARLNLKFKEDIEAYGVKRFTDACRDFCVEMMQGMDADMKQLGYSFKMDDPYMPITKEYIEGVWLLIKRAHDQQRLYPGLRTMHWDPVTETACAKHELTYKNVKDTAIYVAFPLVNDTASLLIWTTTPWTIPLNLAVMVNPGMEYSRIRTDRGEFYVASTLIDSVKEKCKFKQIEIVRSVKGKDLAGLKYVHPLNVEQYFPDELKGHNALYSVLTSTEHVDDSAGTGLVHCAPGCGPEDYEVGHAAGLYPFNCVNEQGVFDGLGDFDGLRAKVDDVTFIQRMGDMVQGKHSYRHDYPHGERSKAPVIFRTTRQWFLKVEDLKERMLEANKNVNWVPKAAGNAFDSWLNNLRDNSITKQRYWGTPVPIWENDSGDIIVVSSVTELEELSGQKVSSLHIPDINISFEKDGSTYHRVPDVLDVWIDAGSASWNCLNYAQNPGLLESMFPIDFIAEGKDQIRGWFNLLMVSSFLMFGKVPFKNVYMNGFVTDVSGEKMSKSLGNVISPKEVVDKHGVDAMRLYFLQARAGVDINFAWDELRQKESSLRILWNVHKLFLDQVKTVPTKPVLDTVDQYMLDRLQCTVNKVTSHMEAYEIDQAPQYLESLYLDLSRFYLQRKRSELGTSDGATYTVHKVLHDTLIMLHCYAPFVTEAMWQNLGFKGSVMEQQWPAIKKVDTTLIDQIKVVQNVETAILAAREKAGYGLRWPLASATIVTDNTVLTEIIKSAVNIRELLVVKHHDDIKVAFQPDFKAVGRRFGKQTQEVAKLIPSLSSIPYESEHGLIEEHHVIRNVTCDGYYAMFDGGIVLLDLTRTKELDLEGYAREVIRRIQSARKTMGLTKELQVEVHVETELDLSSHYSIMEEQCGIKSLHVTKSVAITKFDLCDTFTVKDQKFVLSCRKV